MTKTRTDYECDAIVTGVHDADTIMVRLDLVNPASAVWQDAGWHIWLPPQGKARHFVSVRTFGDNAAELGTPAGDRARDAMVALVPIGTRVHIVSHGLEDDKYGRTLATVYLPDGRSITQVMIDGGYSAPWDGKGPKPVPTS